MKSKISHAVLNVRSRKEKARAIAQVLDSYRDIRNCRIPDIATGSGVIASEIGKMGANVYSVDIRDERIVKKNFIFKKTKDEKLPFKDGEFDIVISNHVMAHVRDMDMHLKETRRVLKEDGIVYLSMLNRLAIIEPNFRLPLLSWLPRKIAGFYVLMFGRGKYYDVNPLTYGKFIGKLRAYFEHEDVTIRLIRKKVSMPASSYEILKFFSPVWVFVLTKKPKSQI